MKKTGDIVFDVIDVLVGIDSAECQMRVSSHSLPPSLPPSLSISEES